MDEKGRLCGLFEGKLKNRGKIDFLCVLTWV